MSRIPPRPVARPQAPVAQVEYAPLAPFAETGEEVDIDPENASDGRIVEETVTIKEPRFVFTDFTKKDGTKSTYIGRDGSVKQSAPKIFIEARLVRASGKAPKVQLEYASGVSFVPSKDGLKLFVRPENRKEGYTPLPKKNSRGWLFLNSLKEQGVSVNMKTGLGVLDGLKVGVRERKVEGYKYGVLMVDFVGDAQSS